MKIIITESSRDRLVFKWLHKEFGDLTPEVKGDKTFYVDRDLRPLFFYRHNIKNGFVFINRERLWSFFKNIFGLDDSQTRDILSIWLEDTYNLGGHPPVVSRMI